MAFGLLAGTHKEDKMKISTRLIGSCMVLDIDGPIQLGAGTAALRGAVQKAAASKPRKIVLNLFDVPYVDSAGIGQLVESYTHAQNQGIELVLMNLDKKIHQLLVITKLITIFKNYDNEGLAVA